jgi:TolB protein
VNLKSDSKMKIFFIIFLVFFLSSCRNIEAEGKIAFVSNRLGNYDIYIMNPDGSDIKNISNHPSLEYGTSWFKNGDYIACYSKRDGKSEIYLLSTAGRGKDIRLTNNEYQDVLPSISPDDKQIAFMSDRNGKSRCLFVMKIDGSDQIMNYRMVS